SGGYWGVDAEHPGQIFYRVPLPPELTQEPRLVVEIQSLDPHRRITFPPIVARPAAGETTVSVPAPRSATRGGMPVEVAASARLVPDLAMREVETPPLAIPPGAVFVGAIAIEQAMWLVNTGAINFYVSAVDEHGHEHVLKKFRVDTWGWPL